MTFKIILSLLFASSLLNIFLIGKDREKHTASSVFVQILINGLITYGLWNWI